MAAWRRLSLLVQQRTSERRLPGAGFPRRRGGPSQRTCSARSPTPPRVRRPSFCAAAHALAQIKFASPSSQDTVRWTLYEVTDELPKIARHVTGPWGTQFHPPGARSEGDKQCRRGMRRQGRGSPPRSRPT